MSSVEKKGKLKPYEITWGEVGAWLVIALAIVFGVFHLVIAYSLLDGYDSDVASAGVAVGMAACYILIAIFFLIVARWIRPQERRNKRLISLKISLGVVIPSILGAIAMILIKRYLL